METINYQHLPIMNNIDFSNSIENDSIERERCYDSSQSINNMVTSNRIPSYVVSSLGSTNDALKFSQIKNAILSNKILGNDNNLKTSPLINSNSITIPTSAEYGIVEFNKNNNEEFSNPYTNEIGYQDKSNFPNITIPTDLNSFLLRNNNKTEDDFQNPYNLKSETPSDLIKNYSLLNTISNSNSTPSINISTLDTPTTYMSSPIDNTLSFNHDLLNKSSIDRLQLLNLMRLINNQKRSLEEINKRSIIDSIHVPSSITEDSDPCDDNNSFNSITIPSEIESTLPNYVQQQQQSLNQNYIKTFQNQQTLSPSMYEMNDFSLSEDKKFKKETSDILSIIINNEPSDTLESSEKNLFGTYKNSQESDTMDSEIFDIFTNSNSKPEEITNYTPLSPELSPLLKGNMMNTTNNDLLKNCIKQNENNAFSSMDTLNDILSLTPKANTLNSFEYETQEYSLDDQQNGTNETEPTLENLQFDPIFESYSKDFEETANASENLLTIHDDEVLDTPATPNSVSNQKDIDFTDFPHLTAVPYEELFNDALKGTVENNTNLQTTNKEKKISRKKKAAYTPRERRGISKEKPKVAKRPRGRPRKKRVEDDLKPPKENMEKISQSIHELLSSDLYSKLYSEDKEDHDGVEDSNSKKEGTTQDYKFVKKVNTLNYILVSYKKMCNALRQTNECHVKTVSEATENQYDIPKPDLTMPIEKYNNHVDYPYSQEVQDSESKEEGLCQDRTWDSKVDETFKENTLGFCRGSESEEESSDNSVEEKSLLVRKKEIQQQNSMKSKTKSKTTRKRSWRAGRRASKKNESRKQEIKENETSNPTLDEIEECVPIKVIDPPVKITRKRKRLWKEEEEEEEEEKAKKDNDDDDDNETTSSPSAQDMTDEMYVDTVTSNPTHKRKVIRLSIEQIKHRLEHGNRLSIGNTVGANSVSALTKNGLVLIGRKRMIAENTNRPYVCSTCGAGFVRKHDLNRHEKVHTGIKNYKCPYCERAFSRNDALTRHLRVELKHRTQNGESKRGRKGSKKKERK